MVFSSVYKDLDIMAKIPPLAMVGPAYIFCLQFMLLELLCMIL